jgi:hypothetical protein
VTGQLALDLGPLPVVEAHHRARGRRFVPVRCYVAPMRRPYMWWRGRRREVTNVPVAIGGLL